MPALNIPALTISNFFLTDLFCGDCILPFNSNEMKSDFAGTGIKLILFIKFI